jgi:transcriptional regulator with XRE-family HTH domain
MNTMNDAFTASLARVLRHELLDAGMTKKALAEETGIGLRTLDRYMDGSRAIPMDAFWRISKSLNVPAADVFEEAERALNKNA